MPRHFVIDATSVRTDRVTGIERYAAGVAAYLPPAMPDTKWTILTSGPVPLKPPAGGDLARIARFSRPVRDQIGIPRFLHSARPMAAFFPGFPPPLLIPHGIKVVAQIHDAAIWRYPETLSRGAKVYYKPSLEMALRRRTIHAVITSSKAAVRDLQPYVPGDIPVFGIPPGVAMHRPTDCSLASSPLTQDSPYALAVGTMEPRKNYETLLKAWELLAERGLRIPLKIVGRAGWGDRAGARSAASQLVDFVGAVTDSELDRLYTHCKIFVMPSLYEGFGVPVVEAMLRGRPCLVSDIPVFHEIGGPLLTYISPKSVADWAEAVESAWTVPQPQQYALVERAEHFTWERCADAIAAVFREIIL